MAISAPVILSPSGGIDYTTDSQTQTLSGTTGANTDRIKVNGSTLGVSYTSGDVVWSWTGLLNVGLNLIGVVAVEQITENESFPTSISVTYVETTSLIEVNPPTGVRLRRFQDKIEVICSKNTESDVIGYNFYVSSEGGGGRYGYAKINSALVGTSTFYEDDVVLLSQNTDQAGSVRVTTTTEQVNRVFFYSVFFDADVLSQMVSENLIPNVPFDTNTKFFFVMTAVAYNSSRNVVTESPYSSELEGSPIIIGTLNQNLPPRTQSDIILTFNNSIMQGNPGVDLKPGTVLRDTMDPVSEEIARVYIIQDFLASASSIRTLLAFDDADGDGISDSVVDSPLKTQLQVALNITSADDVQTIVDSQFDNLASNVNVVRRGSTNATGTVTFYISSVPVRDMIINENAIVSTLGNIDLGETSQSYRVLATKVMSVSDIDSYFNPQTQRYEITADVEATTVGSIGNANSNTVVAVDSGVDSDFSVTNVEPISFGQDRESNLSLATRTELAIASVDTGTEAGYANLALSINGVRKVRVEKAGDSLMLRDYDPIRQEHVGGKVDLYIQGSREQQVSDKIAFSFETSQGGGGTTGEQFIIESVESFRFRSNNIRVTAHTPIFDVSKVRNATKGKDYDLTGYVVIGDGDVVELDESLPLNSSIGLSATDIIVVDYKFRASDVYILDHQPVNEIISIVGELSGALTSENWELVKLQDPLEEGESTISQDGVRIIFANGLPLSDFQTIEDELHTLLLNTEEPLTFIGADLTTLVITDVNKTITYVRDDDYIVTQGTTTSPTTIRIMEGSRIQNGQQILASYDAIENFTVTYVNNSLLAQVQEKVDSMKHACADVIVKQAIENDVDFIITVVPRDANTNQSLLSSKIQTAVANYINVLGLGRSLYQSDVIGLMEKIPEIDFVVVPFLKMVKADGSFIVRDDVSGVIFSVFNQDINATSYVTVDPVLTYKTIEKGGPDNQFRGVFENNLPLVLVDDPFDVSGGPGRAYIRGDGRIIVSTRDGQLPDIKTYQVSYLCYGETGSKDIIVSSLETVAIGSFSIIYATRAQAHQEL